MTTPGRFVAGRLGRPWGLKGEVRISTGLEDMTLLEGAEGLTYALPDADPQQCAVRRVRRRGDITTVQLDGVRDRDQAMALRGAVLSAPVDILPPPEEGEFYPHQVLGLEVRDPDGEVMGEVADILDAGGGATPNLVIRPPMHADAPHAREVLIPAHPDYIVDVDLDTRVVQVRPPEHADDTEKQ